MNKVVSPYYPPRARWYRPRRSVGASIKRRLHLDRLRLPGTVSLRGFIGGLLVPGLAFSVRGARLWGRAAMAASGVLLAAFFVWLGQPAGNVAFGLLLSIHSTGVVHLCEPWLTDTRLRTRILVSMAVLMALGGGLYLPARRLVQERWFLPMNVEGRVVVVRAYARAESVRRGDWIAYSINNSGGQGIYVRAGHGFGPVLAVAGDAVRFGQTLLEVNGVRQPRRDHMPASGDWLVPENGWFVWPELDIRGHGYVGEAVLSQQLMKMATVRKEQFVGKPFKRWFWRRQILP